MSDQYEEFYARANTSKAFSDYCKDVYEIDLTQDGFSDRRELDMMINFAGITSDDVVLDIGCGNGKIDQYINGRTGARILGVDFSVSAMEYACKLSTDAMHFMKGDINELHLTRSYDAIILIDSIYFSKDYNETLKLLYGGLSKNGRIVLMYSEFLFEEMQKRKLTVDDTRIAGVTAKNGWNSRSEDLTKNLFHLMRRKRVASERYRSGLEEEGNSWLFRKVHDESIELSMSYANFEIFTNRFIYCIEK